MNSNFKALIFISLLFGCLFTNAQQGQFILKGKLVEDGKPLQSASINIIQNKITVNSAISNENGEFLIKQIKGNYFLEVRFLGKLLFEKLVSLNSDTDFGKLNLQSTRELKDVNIVGIKKIFERRVDRLVFNVAGNIPNLDGSAIDVLKITPNLIANDESVTMVGKNQSLLMVNGKQIKLSGSDLTSYIKSIPANNISSIEVYSIPPAKYDAEGNSGLININLKKSKQNFYNGSLNSSFSQSKHSVGTLGGNLNVLKISGLQSHL